MSKKNPHLLKRASLFSMFCLSYFPLFLLLGLKIIMSKSEFLYYKGFSIKSILMFLEHFGFVFLLVILSIYAFLGTKMTFRNIKKNSANYTPVNIINIKPRNEESLSYLATYVIPLVAQGEMGSFEYITFIVLFIIYYKLYSTSSLILINPILNMKYGLHEIDYIEIGKNNNEKKNALIITKQKWLEEGDNLKIMKLSHRLFFAKE